MIIWIFELWLFKYDVRKEEPIRLFYGNLKIYLATKNEDDHLLVNLSRPLPNYSFSYFLIFVVIFSFLNRHVCIGIFENYLWAESFISNLDWSRPKQISFKYLRKGGPGYSIPCMYPVSWLQYTLHVSCILVTVYPACIVLYGQAPITPRNNRRHCPSLPPPDIDILYMEKVVARSVSWHLHAGPRPHEIQLRNLTAEAGVHSPPTSRFPWK